MSSSESEAPTFKAVAAYRRLLGYTARYWYAFAGGILGYLLFAGTEAGAASYTGFVVDAIKDGHVDEHMRIVIPLGMVLIFLARGLGSFVGDYGVSYAARSVVHALRTEMFARILVLPSQHFATQTAGHLVAKLTYDVEQVTAAATESIKVLLKEGLTVVALLGYLFWQNWKLTLIILLVLPIIALLVNAASRRFRTLSQRLQGSVGDVTHVASEAINGAQVVKVFGGTEYEAKRFDAVSQYNLRQSMKMVVTRAINTPAIQVILSIPLGIIVWLALRPEIMGNMSAGDFIAYLTALGVLVKPARTLTDINEKVQRGIAAAQSIFALIDSPSEPAGGSHAPERVQGHITFRNVHFRYPGADTDVLKGIELDIPAGTNVALVGRSGGGKTTLVSLLPRFHDATGGEILVDGVPLNDYSMTALRRQISVVYQRVTLFDDTVAANIAYGDCAGATRAEIVAAAAAANAREFIEKLPNGFDTPIGHDGMQLSGGQRQRVAIARALLKNAPILILDEATSALDNESERHIQVALEHLMKDRTTFVIAHRLSTIERADLILVLEDGRIVEQGTHAALISRDGAYARLHQHQFADDSAES